MTSRSRIGASGVVPAEVCTTVLFTLGWVSIKFTLDCTSILLTLTATTLGFAPAMEAGAKPIFAGGWGAGNRSPVDASPGRSRGLLPAAGVGVGVAGGGFGVGVAGGAVGARVGNSGRTGR